MIPPHVQCFCGRELGCYYDIFVAIRRQKYREEFSRKLKEHGVADREFNPMFAPISDLPQISMIDVFEQLHINVECCRARLATQVTFRDVY